MSVLISTVCNSPTSDPALVPAHPALHVEFRNTHGGQIELQLVSSSSWTACGCPRRKSMSTSVSKSRRFVILGTGFIRSASARNAWKLISSQACCQTTTSGSFQNRCSVCCWDSSMKRSIACRINSLWLCLNCGTVAEVRIVRSVR